MLTFFRKIRKSLIDSSSARKYLLYAIGEIALVVIGILIALQINIWNNRQAKNKKIESIMFQIRQDLIDNVVELDQAIIWHLQKDSLISLFLSDQVSENEIKNKRWPFYLATTTFHAYIHTKGYDNLIPHLDALPSELESIAATLHEIFVADLKEYEYDSEVFSQTALNTEKHLKNTFPWYSEVVLARPPDQAVEYFLNDPLYRNEVLFYWEVSFEQKFNLSKLRGKSIDCIKLINNLYDIDHSAEIHEVLYSEDVNLASHFIGEYSNQTALIQIYKEEEFMILEASPINSSGGSKFKVYPINDQIFQIKRLTNNRRITFDPRYYKIITDDQGLVSGLKAFVRFGLLEFTKTKNTSKTDSSVNN